MWDATSADTLAPYHVMETALRAGVTAENAETNIAQIFVTDSKLHLCPFLVETLELWRRLGMIAPRLIASTGDKRASPFSPRDLGFVIQRGNAANVLGTIPRVVNI